MVLRGNRQSMVSGFPVHSAVSLSWGKIASLSSPQCQCGQRTLQTLRSHAFAESLRHKAVMNFSVCSRKQGLGFEMFCQKGVRPNLKFKLLDGVVPVHVFSLRGVWFRLYSVGQTDVNPVPTPSTAPVTSHQYLDLQKGRWGTEVSRVRVCCPSQPLPREHCLVLLLQIDPGGCTIFPQATWNGVNNRENEDDS